ncbi:MAG TPA: VOC family protein [Caulobacteraceae bacterium]|nr:VOC family protein [Caulobacteraceae bacterium]
MRAAFAYAIKYVADMDRAVSFYRDTFGLKLKFATPIWSEFDTGPVTLALHPASERNPAGGVQLGFTTPELAERYAARDAEGVTFSAAPRSEHGALLARILDSEGAEVRLGSAPA